MGGTYLNLESMKKKAEAIKRQLERKRKRLAAEEEKQRTSSDNVLRLREEIHALDDTLTLLLSRMGRSAQEAQELLESTLPPMPDPEEEQAQNAPESEVIHEEAE